MLPAADVEDVLQETFLGVWRGAAATGPRAPGGWLWGIARRQAALLAAPPWAGGPAGHRAGRRAGGGTDARRSGRGRAARADLADAVAALGPEGSPHRETWRLMYVEERTVAEVAELMGVPAGTVKSRAYQARRLMRAALRAEPARMEAAMTDDDTPGAGRRRSGPGLDRGGRPGVAPPARAGWNGWPARLLRSPGLARALVTTPSLLLGWIAGTAVVLAAGALATRWAPAPPYVALLAPAAGRGGIAYAYGPGDRRGLGAVLQHGGQ